MERIEIRNTVDAENDRLAIDDELLLAVLERGFDNPRIAVRPVEAVAGNQPRPILRGRYGCGVEALEQVRFQPHAGRIRKVKEFVKPKESMPGLFLLNCIADISSGADETAGPSFTMNKRRSSNEEVAEQRIGAIRQGLSSAHLESS